MFGWCDLVACNTAATLSSLFRIWATFPISRHCATRTPVLRCAGKRRLRLPAPSHECYRRTRSVALSLRQKQSALPSTVLYCFFFRFQYFTIAFLLRRNLDLILSDLNANFAEGSEYFSVLVKIFQGVFLGEKQAHLKQFYIISTCLVLSQVRHATD